MGLLIYFIGLVLATICASYDLYKANKRGDVFKEVFAMFSALVLLSWFTVLLYIYRFYKIKTL